MRVTINQYGQVLKIEDSFLVANASFIKQEHIDFVIKGLTEEQRDKLELGFLSVVRQDGFPVNDLIMARSIDLESGDLTFSHKVSDSSQIFACAGNIQISLQAKGLRDDIELLDPSVMGDMDYYQTFASCTVVGHVQKNIGTEEEYDLVSTKINDAVANLQMTVADSQNKADKALKLAQNAASGGVVSVSGKKGEVVLVPADVGLDKVENRPIDTTPQKGSENYISSGATYDALDEKQDKISFDDTPTEDSNNPVKSGGVFTALSGKLPTTTTVCGKSASNGNYAISAKDVGALPSDTVIPSKVSQLDNDSKYINEENLSLYDGEIKQHIADAIAGAITTTLNTAV